MLGKDFANVYKHIQNHLAKDIYPFHMPGHKGNPAFFPKNLQGLDVTEIPGMDVLSAPTGIIRELEANIADFFGARRSFFLVNGSSCGIMAAICATCREGAPIMVPRNAHTSVYNGLVHSGARPIYYMPEVTADGLSGGVLPSALEDMPYGATVLVVSPTYEGFVSHIAAIADKVHEKGGLLIVDEAHGAHFPFHEAFPTSAIALGADIVVQSLHKTLPASSQCGVLHVSRTVGLSLDALAFYINAMQTSSPSYMFMAICDYMLRLLWENTDHFATYVAQLTRLREILPHKDSGTSLYLSGVERVNTHGIFDVDIGKLLFCSQLPGHEVETLWAETYHVQIEMAMAQHVLAMTSVADTQAGFDRLRRAVEGVCTPTDEGFCYASPMFRPLLAPPPLTPRQALQRPSFPVPWEQGVGKISAQVVAQYPPGIALVAPGEMIPPDLPPQSPTIRIVHT